MKQITAFLSNRICKSLLAYQAHGLTLPKMRMQTIHNKVNSNMYLYNVEAGKHITGTKHYTLGQFKTPIIQAHIPLGSSSGPSFARAIVRLFGSARSCPLLG